MHRSLTKLGYILNKDQLDKQQISQTKKDLTVRPLVIPAYKEFQDNDSPYPIYLESPKRLFLPRFYGIEKWGQPSKNCLKPGKQITISDNIKLFPNQLTAFDKTVKQLKTVGGGVLSLPCGSGKTILALKIICTLKIKSIVIVNKDFLMSQWIERIQQFIPDAKIGIIQQNKIQVEDRDIVIGMIHSVSMKNYDKKVFEEFGLAIVDETHHASAEMFSKSLPKISCQYQLGLSATPERKDGLSYVFYYYLGPLFHSERRSGSNQVIIKQIRISSESPSYDVLYNTIRGKQFKNTKGMIGKISKFDQRNKLILEMIKLMISQKRKILVLSELRDHLEYFHDTLLPQASIRTSDNKFATYGLYYGKAPGTKKKDHEAMLEKSSKCDIVLGTCAMASEALDIPTLNTLIFATPMTDVEQASGRILRKYHKDCNPLIIDLIDDFANFKRHGQLREKYFKSEDYIIQETSIYLDDNPAKNLDEFSKVITYLSNNNKPADDRRLIQDKFDLECTNSTSTKQTDNNSHSKKTIVKPKTKSIMPDKQKYKQGIYSKALDKVIEIEVKPAKNKSKHHPETNMGVCLL